MTQEAFTEAILDAQARDDSTLQALAEHHLPLVRMLMRRIAWHSVSREDLFQQGCVGLMKALRGYDPSRGTAFSTYAAPFILGEMRTLCHEETAVHVPRTDREKRNLIRRAQHALQQQLMREPNMTELAQYLDMEPTELALLMENVTVSSLDATQPDDDTPLADRLPDGNDPWLERLMLRDMFARLPPEDRRLLFLRNHEGLSQAETARRMGVHQSQVSRRENALIAGLREAWYAEAE